MNRALLYIGWLIGLLIGGVFGSALMAQTNRAEPWRELAHPYLEKGWLQSENAAGLLVFDEAVLSEIQLYAETEQGGLKNYHSSERAWGFGAQAASLYRLSQRVVVQGEIGYQRTTAYDLAGSYFMDPQQTPFDLVEYTDENRGDKLTEEYLLKGGVGVDLTAWLALGASLDYTAANYVKRKDLRHTNSLMDLELTLGGVFHIGKRLDLGLNYSYRRRNETLLLSAYGTQDKTFVSLLNYGAFFGKQEVFGEVGYTKENENKPLFDKYHGAAVQLVWRITPRIEWFSELGGRTREGYYGDPSHSTVVYAEHEGNELFYKGVLTRSGGHSNHTFVVDLTHKSVETAENIYAYRNEETGREYIEYLGEREVVTRSNQSASLRYTGRYDVEQGLARWEWSAVASLAARDIKASNYPDYRRQQLHWWNVTTAVTRNIASGRDSYALTLTGLYGGGSGAPCKDGRYELSNDGEALTRTRDDLLMQEWEFLTATQVGGGIAFGYARILGKNGLRGFADLRYEVRTALDVDHLGNGVRQVVKLQVGCKF